MTGSDDCASCYLSTSIDKRVVTTLLCMLRVRNDTTECYLLSKCRVNASAEFHLLSNGFPGATVSANAQSCDRQYLWRWFLQLYHLLMPKLHWKLPTNWSQGWKMMNISNSSSSLARNLPPASRLVLRVRLHQGRHVERRCGEHTIAYEHQLISKPGGLRLMTPVMTPVK